MPAAAGIEIKGMSNQKLLVRLYCRHNPLVVHNALFRQKAGGKAGIRKSPHHQKFHNRSRYRIMLKFQEFPYLKFRTVLHRLLHHLLRPAVLFL